LKPTNHWTQRNEKGFGHIDNLELRCHESGGGVVFLINIFSSERR
jgi:hypothetical protein